MYIYIYILPISTPDNSQLIACAFSIKQWLLSNNLLLNASQTALLNIHTNSSSFHFFISTRFLFHLPTQSSILVLLLTLIYLFLAILLTFLKLLIIIYLESNVSVNILLVPYVLSLLIHL